MPKSEKSNKQIEYESALVYIHQKGFDIETTLKRGKPDMIEYVILKDGKKFVDSKGKDRVSLIPFNSDMLKVIADKVINLYTYLKSKEQ